MSRIFSNHFGCSMCSSYFQLSTINSWCERRRRQGRLTSPTTCRRRWRGLTFQTSSSTTFVVAADAAERLAAEHRPENRIRKRRPDLWWRSNFEKTTSVGSFPGFERSRKNTANTKSSFSLLIKKFGFKNLLKFQDEAGQVSMTVLFVGSS